MNQTASLTKEQKNKIHLLVSAQNSLQQALADINAALGDSDVDQWYSNDLKEMIQEIETDIENVWSFK